MLMEIQLSMSYFILNVPNCHVKIFDMTIRLHINVLCLSCHYSGGLAVLLYHVSLRAQREEQHMPVETRRQMLHVRRALLPGWRGGGNLELWVFGTG